MSDDPVRVVIADDHAPTREDVRIALEEDPRFLVVAEAPDAFGAIEAAVREQPELCLLDVHMPGGGAKATWEISARLPTTKIVMLTVSRDDTDLFAALPRALVARLIEQYRDRAPRRRTVVGGEEGEGRLTSREWQVLDLVRQEMSNSQIARRLDLSPVTVRTHVNSIIKKMGVPDREALVRRLDER